MKVALTNLSNELYAESRYRLNSSAVKFGINEIKSYDFEDLRGTEFYAKHRSILDQPKGMGFWMWKPYIILETMKTVEDGDVVIYCDAGIEIIAPLDPLVRICANEQPILLFANGNFRNSLWTTRDCFVFMNADDAGFWNATHVDASFCLFRKTAESIRFLEEWLSFAGDERIMKLSGSISGKEELKDFIEFRWDQSILSILAKKYETPLYRMPSQFGNHYKVEALRVTGEFNAINQLNQKQVKYYSKNSFVNSRYGQLLDHHRSSSSKNTAAISKPNIIRQIIQKLKRVTKSQR